MSKSEGCKAVLPSAPRKDYDMEYQHQHLEGCRAVEGILPFCAKEKK